MSFFDRRISNVAFFYNIALWCITGVLVKFYDLPKWILILTVMFTVLPERKDVPPEQEDDDYYD